MLAAYVLLVSQKMQAVRSSEALVNFYRTTLRHIPEGILKPVSEPGYFVAS
jgi:hypothetical protein